MRHLLSYPGELAVPHYRLSRDAEVSSMGQGKWMKNRTNWEKAIMRSKANRGLGGQGVYAPMHSSPT